MHTVIKALVLSSREQLWAVQKAMFAFLAFRSLALGDANGWKKWAPKAAAIACTGDSLRSTFYSSEDPSSLLPFWNSKSLNGMLSREYLIMGLMTTLYQDKLSMAMELASG